MWGRVGGGGVSTQAGRTVPGVRENPGGHWGHSRGIKGKRRRWDKNGNSDLF